MWLGHGKTGDDVIIEQRLQKFLLLLGRAVVRQDFRIAGVWGLRAKDYRREA